MKYIKYLLIMALIFVSVYSVNVLAAGNGAYFLAPSSCVMNLGAKTNEIVKTFIQIIAWGVPTFIIALTVVDILKAVTSGDVKDTNLIFKKLGLRLLISALVFLTPQLLRLIFGALGLSFCFYQ